MMSITLRFPLSFRKKSGKEVDFCVAIISFLCVLELPMKIQRPAQNLLA